MKNWLRQEDDVKEWFRDTLTSSAFRESGLFNTEYVTRLLDEHAKKSHNHSHRLWALMVLENWLEKHWRTNNQTQQAQRT